MTDTCRRGPLAGTRVIELAGIGPSPFAGMLLADLGADVLRIDRPIPPEEPHGPRQPFLRSRRSVILDLKRPEGVTAALELVRTADVLIEGYRPGVAERLGVGPEECAKVNPRLVYGRMTGWGQTGPWADAAGHDINYIGLVGALHAIGSPESPAPPLNLVGNFGGGALYLTVGVLAALREAERSGMGQVVDAAMADGAASLMTFVYGFYAEGIWKDERGRNIIDGGYPWYNTYRTADGKWMAVGALETEYYEEFVRTLGVDVSDKPRSNEDNWPALRKLFRATFATKTRDEWAATFSEVDACVTPVLSLAEAPQHPHLVARDSFVTSAGIAQPNVTPRFSRTPGRIQSVPTSPGASTQDALNDWGLINVEHLIATGVAIQGRR